MATACLLAPNIPLVFMGVEYGETAPFLYFIEHGEPVLVDAVRKGRQAEFASFASEGEESDPQDPATFERSRVHPGPQTQGECVQLLCWYRRLIGIRTSIPALGAAQRDQHEHDLWVEEGEQILVLPRRALHSQAALVILSFNRQQISVTLRKPLGTWELIVASWDLEFGGSGRNHFPAQWSLEKRSKLFLCRLTGWRSISTVSRQYNHGTGELHSIKRLVLTVVMR